MKGYIVMSSFLAAILTIVYANTREMDYPEDKALSVLERRNIAIDFMSEYPSWKYTLCSLPEEDFTDTGVGCGANCL